MALVLSKRLRAIANMVTPGNRLCDVGCDHAYLDIALLQEGKIEKALAMDVAEGPLQIAQQNLMLTGLEDRCETRLSDGLSAYKRGEADTLVIAGMGGILMEAILEKYPARSESFKELILSPQSEQAIVRSFLTDNGYVILEEDFVEDEGKFYPVIRAAYRGKAAVRCPMPEWAEYAEKVSLLPEEVIAETGIPRETLTGLLSDAGFTREAEMKYGPRLIAQRNEVLFEFIVLQLKGIMEIYRKVSESSDTSRNARGRLAELSGEIGMMQVLLFLHKHVL